MDKHLRRALPLINGAGLTALALLTLTSTALAGKPAPIAEARSESAVCEYRFDSYTHYRVAWDTTASKGKWLYAEAWLEGVDTNLDDRSARFVKRAYEQVEAELSGTPRVATMTLQFFDRKGNELGDPHRFTFVPATCEV